MDAALDREQGVDAPDRLQRDRRDHGRRPAAPGVAGNVGQLEELAPSVRPAKGRCHRPGGAVGIVEAVIAAIGVGLQDTAKHIQVMLGVRAGPIARGVEEGRRRIGAAERPVVPDVGPDPAGRRLALGQDRHGRVVGVQPLGRQHMRLDQAVERCESRRAGPDLVGER
jgi:hypothetical protein